MTSDAVAPLTSLVEPETVAVKLQAFGLFAITEDLLGRRRFLSES